MCQVKGGKCSFENALAEKRNDIGLVEGINFEILLKFNNGRINYKW